MKNYISNKTLENLAKGHIKYITSKRRWKIFVRTVLILIIVLTGIFYTSTKKLSPHIALVRVQGLIAEDSESNSNKIIKSLDNAYSSKLTKAVIVKINSSGGSPVQSDEIYSHMQYLQKQYPKIPIYAVCTDVCASGGYYIAAGAKEIYVNKMTITGSIGVIANSFDFTAIMDKLGIKRRTYTAGYNKDFLDPFSPEKNSQTKHFKKLLDETHQVFINAIEKSRGDRLKDKSITTTFSGYPFSGIEAQKIGLVDGFASVDHLKKVKLNNLDIIDYTEPLNFITVLSNKLGHSIYYKILSNNNFSFK